MSTATDIINVALRRIGAQRIGDIKTDGTNEGRVARDLYDEARRSLLTQHSWNFAIRREELEQTDDLPESGWDYAYVLPDNFLRLLNVSSSEDDSGTVPYALENMEGEDRVLLCNSNTVFIRFIFDCDDPSIFSAPFRDALSWMLARDFAAALSKSTSAAELADRSFIRALNKAKSIDGVEDWPEKMAEGDWITSRSGYDPSRIF